MKSKDQKPTAGEMAILEALWELGPSTVRQVNDLLNTKKDGKAVTYTTTLKFMQLMHKKGMLSRQKEGVGHIYTPTISEKENLQKTLDEIVEKTFHGSAMKLVMQILGSHKSSSDELNKIREFLDDLDEESSELKNQKK